MEMNSKQPLISVILPIYNVAAYLSGCLESVINQTYANLEIILVNDGSTDNCPEICEVYAEKDNRIRVIHKPNGGLSDARNAGMGVATGELISFVDSDDLLSTHFFQKLFQALSDHDADIAECEFQKFVNEEEISYNTYNTENHMQVFEGEKTMEALFKGPLHVMVWNKLYKIELVRDIIFPVNRISEDVFWTYKIYGRSTKTVKIDDDLYFYRQRDNSIMGNRYSIKRLDSMDAYEEITVYLKAKFPKLLLYVSKMHCFLLMNNYYQIELHTDLDPDHYHRKNLLKKIKKFNHWSELKNWSWKDLIWYKLFLCSPSGYGSLRSYMDKKSAKFQNARE